jgi:hypothetical protein
LGDTLKVRGAQDVAQQGLWGQQLFDAAAQQWPVVLGDGEVTPQVEHGDLPYLACNALTAHETVGEVALASGFVVGAGLSNKHACHANRKNTEIEINYKILWHNKTSNKIKR